MILVGEKCVAPAGDLLDRGFHPPTFKIKVVNFSYDFKKSSQKITNPASGYLRFTFKFVSLMERLIQGLATMLLFAFVTHFATAGNGTQATPQIQKHWTATDHSYNVELAKPDACRDVSPNPSPWNTPGYKNGVKDQFNHDGEQGVQDDPVANGEQFAVKTTNQVMANMLMSSSMFPEQQNSLSYYSAQTTAPYFKGAKTYNSSMNSNVLGVARTKPTQAFASLLVQNWNATNDIGAQHDWNSNMTTAGLIQGKENC